MAISGIFLWWPRSSRRGAWKSVAVPSLRLRGRARDFNWHNSMGIWCAPVLAVITLTGAVMSYQWANDLPAHRQRTAAAGRWSGRDGAERRAPRAARRGG
jgi:uncharacterized iron-regulated membrane protein